MALLAAASAACSFAQDKPAPTPLDAAKTAMQASTAERDAARKALEEKAAAAKAAADAVAAAQAAAEKLPAAKAAADKAASDKAAAEKLLAEKETAFKAAQETILAEEAYAAHEAVKQANTDKTKAEQTLAEKSAAAQQKAVEAATAQSAAEKTNAEKAAAEKNLADKVAVEKAATDKLTGLTAAGSQTPPDQLAAAKAVAAKASADKAAAEKWLGEKTAAASVSAGKAKAAAAAQAAAAAEKSGAEQALAQKTAAIPPALERAAAAQANLVGGLRPLAGSAWDYNKARHLLWRAGFGGPPEEVAKLHAMGLHGAVRYLVDFQSLPEPDCSVDIRLPEKAMVFENRLTEPERTKLGNERTSRRFQQQAALRSWWLHRMVETQRPLEEKLALFWHGHFAVNFTKNENPQIMHRQNKLFREFAAGNFGALLRGIAQDPAMIAYLDNQVNFKDAGNENLGREILELFSMGEGQGYSEQDLREASRALTGYSYDYSTGQFKFIATRHDETPKTIFGRAGNWGGDDLVDMILQQPSTARFIATKLFRFLVHDAPSAETIDRLANVLRVCGYDLAPMLENLFLSEEFYSAPAMAAHIKSPAELMVGTVRALGLKEVNYGAVDGALQTMGQTLFEPPNVKGWDGGRDWINASRLLVRYNSVVNLVDQGAVDLVGSLERGGLHKADAVVDHLAKAFLVLPLGDARRAELIRFLGELPPPADWPKQRDALNAKLRALLATMLSTPEYQLAHSSAQPQGDRLLTPTLSLAVGEG